MEVLGLLSKLRLGALIIMIILSLYIVYLHIKIRQLRSNIEVNKS